MVYQMATSHETLVKKKKTYLSFPQVLQFVNFQNKMLSRGTCFIEVGYFDASIIMQDKGMDWIGGQYLSFGAT